MCRGRNWHGGRRAGPAASPADLRDEETGVAWAADESLAELYPETAGSRQIDEWVSDGVRASGTATFIQLEPWSAPVEGASPVTGSFELGCADD